ncbi:hypothetical protein GE09DRAFT_716258 [Coniochaeta sp. 2T2.1]|nr:hypothetical protein GE09DRAFT_716258 [Coniochaeta sp. 2T2.1]
MRFLFSVHLIACQSSRGISKLTASFSGLSPAPSMMTVMIDQASRSGLDQSISARLFPYIEHNAPGKAQIPAVRVARWLSALLLAQPASALSSSPRLAGAPSRNKRRRLDTSLSAWRCFLRFRRFQMSSLLHRPYMIPVSDRPEISANSIHTGFSATSKSTAKISGH